MITNALRIVAALIATAALGIFATVALTPSDHRAAIRHTALRLPTDELSSSSAPARPAVTVSARPVRTPSPAPTLPVRPYTPPVTEPPVPAPQPSWDGTGIPHGNLTCSGLEALWDDAGGNPAYEVLAASVARAESGGRQYALSPTDDYGYWQINRAAHGALATYDPLGNARAAIIISGDGTDWNAWTTYRDGAYRGLC